MPVSIDNAAQIARALPLSRFLTRLLDSRPEIGAALREQLHMPWTGQAMRAFLAAQAGADETVHRNADEAAHRNADETALRPGLRRLRAAVMARLAVRDLAGLADLAEVTETMTTLADVAVGHTVAVLSAALTARYGTPRSAAGEAQELIVVGMGKLGGRELNVSSDIDLIFVYPEDGETDGVTTFPPAPSPGEGVTVARGLRPLGKEGGGPRLSNFEFFTRLGRQLIGALAEITGDGQVFRVDMRLRPNGESGPLVASFDMLENYFVTQGREWERYAWIKARPLCGNRGAELSALARPFVFRKYLDYGAINAMRDLHAQIRREVARKDMAEDIKLGPGGIREIEFIAQVFQLIRGGRERALQVRPTLDVLALLAKHDILDETAVRELTDAYRFLRALEHRLQYLDDAQTHALPGKAEDQIRIACGMKMDSLPRSRGRVGGGGETAFPSAPFPRKVLATMPLSWKPSTITAPTSAAASRPFSPIPTAKATTLPACGKAAGMMKARTTTRRRKPSSVLAMATPNPARGGWRVCATATATSKCPPASVTASTPWCRA